MRSATKERIMRRLETTCGKYENTNGVWVRKSDKTIVPDAEIDNLIDNEGVGVMVFDNEPTDPTRPVAWPTNTPAEN